MHGHGHHGFEIRGADVPRGRFAETGRFGRLFPYLRNLYRFDPGPAELGKFGGPMDGGNPPASDTSQDNPRIRAGYTFLGQFIDHDLTLDATSVLEQQIDPEATHNFRTPVLELDSVYGLGPSVQPYLYDGNNPGHLLIAENNADLPRNAQGTALIGDPRNDENVIISQLHLLFLKFHNKVFDEHTDSSLGRRERFEAAQRLVRWHYQWIVIHEFLARTVGRKTILDALKEKPFRYTEVDAFMPVEFSVAAYRFGHSQVRPGYPTNGANGAILFPANAAEPPSDFDLRGGRPVPERLRIDWVNFFGTAAVPSKLIDTKLSQVLLKLPGTVVPDLLDDHPHRSLAVRNLQRGLDVGLPAGQTVARFLEIPALKENKIWKDVPGGRGLAPLWFYILREAEVLAKGHRLAGVGALIVAQVFAALLHADRASFVVQDPKWTPTLGPTKGKFTVVDLANFTLGTNVANEDVDALPTP